MQNVIIYKSESDTAQFRGFCAVSVTTLVVKNPQV